MPKAVAIVILNWNTPHHTLACIASVQQYCNEQLFDMIVADNGSTDDSLALIKAYHPEVIYIDNKVNLGFAEGNNRALTYSIQQGYKYSLLMNSDTLVDEDIVTKLHAHIDAHINVGAVQPAIYWLHNKTKIWNGTGIFNPIKGRPSSPPPAADLGDNFASVKWVTGCCAILRNSALQHSGLFNKNYFLYYEDVELSYRLRRNGFELHYLPTCKMYHEAGVSGKVKTPGKEGYLSPVIHYYITRNLFWFLREYAHPLLYPVNLLYNLAYYLLVLVYFVLRGRKQKARYITKALTDGIFKPKSLIYTTNISTANS